MYTQRTIKKHKGKLVSLKYWTKDHGERNEREITGEILANTKTKIIFDVNKENFEITLTYDQIISIDKPIKV